MAFKSSGDHHSDHSMSTPSWLSVIASAGHPTLGGADGFSETPCFEDFDDFNFKTVKLEPKSENENSTARVCSTTIAAKKISLHFPKSFETKCPATLDEILINDLKNQTRKDFVDPFHEQSLSKRNLNNSPSGLSTYPSTSMENHSIEVGPITSLMKELGTKKKVPIKMSAPNGKISDDILGTSLPRSFGSPFMLSPAENFHHHGGEVTTDDKWTGDDADAEMLSGQNSSVFGSLPSSAKLSCGDLIKIKNEILKTKTSKFDLEFSVEKSLEHLNKMKREILASHGHDIYLQNNTAAINQMTEESEIFEMESEKTKESDEGDSDHPETEKMVEKLTGYFFNHPFAQNWFFKNLESGISSGSDSPNAEGKNVESVARSCPPDNVSSGFSGFLTRSRTVPHKLEDLNVWTPTDL